MIPEYFIRLYNFKKISPTRCRLEIDKDSQEICICKQLYSVKNKNKVIPVYKVIWNDESFISFELNKKFFMIEENCLTETKDDIKKIIMEG